MKKFNEIRQTMQDTSYLIARMKLEIDSLRHIVARYNAMHGTSIQVGELKLDGNISFMILGDAKAPICKRIDHKDLGINSQYMDIVEGIKKLS